MKLQSTEESPFNKVPVTFGEETSAGMVSFSLGNYTPYQFAIISSRLSRTLELSYGTQHGLARAEWRTLALACEQERCASSELVLRAGLDAVAIHRAVKRLEALGYLTRQSDTDDKRKRRLSVTAAGRAVYEQVVPHALALEQRLFKNLSQTEARTLRKVLNKLCLENFDSSGSSL